MGTLTNWWRRLVSSGSDSPAARKRAAPTGGVKLNGLPPPPGFTPREAEIVYAEVDAFGRDSSKGLDLGGGILLITSKGVVFLNSRKKWRFPWRTMDLNSNVSSQALLVMTNHGKRFSFKMASSADAESISLAFTTLIQAMEE